MSIKRNLFQTCLQLWKKQIPFYDLVFHFQACYFQLSMAMYAGMCGASGNSSSCDTGSSMPTTAWHFCCSKKKCKFHTFRFSTWGSVFWWNWLLTFFGKHMCFLHPWKIIWGTVGHLTGDHFVGQWRRGRNSGAKEDDCCEAGSSEAAWEDPTNNATVRCRDWAARAET